MKSKILAALVFVGLAVLTPNVSLAQEQINSFDVKIKINADSSIRVTENIVYDFGTAQRHGIYRDIPYKYQTRGGNFNLRLSDFTVTDQTGKPWQFSLSTQGQYKRVKIGDPNVLITGLHTYVIGYTVKRAINYFDDHDELYWNATGNAWLVPILKSKAQVELPQNVTTGNFQVACFAGVYDSTRTCAGIASTTASAIFSQNLLKPGEGLTVVVGFPKGLVTKPSAFKNSLETVKDNWYLVIPFFTLIFLLYWWRTRGKDPDTDTVIAQYEPPDGLSPTEVGTILDEKADNQDISAELIQLAVDGKIKITRLEKKLLMFDWSDYQLDLLNADSNPYPDFRENLVHGLFEGNKTSVKLSEIKYKFYDDLALIKKKVYESVEGKGYFVKNPQKVRRNYRMLGLGLMLAGIIFGAWLGKLLLVLSLAVSGLLFIIFAPFMPVKTRKGARAKAHILGLKLYLSVVEQDRLKFFNAPEKSPQRFEKLLPYAIALKVEKEWAKQFEDIYTTQPSWYSDNSGTGFNAVVLAGSLSHFSHSANATIAARPGSSSGGAWGGGSGFGGGGFSGGGFGGGGGGSW